MAEKISAGASGCTGRHCVVDGHVQGVFFRASTLEEARRLGLTGWVRNLHDRRVEIRVFGSAEPVDQLCGWLRTGPPQARVNTVHCEPIDYERHESFQIV